MKTNTQKANQATVSYGMIEEHYFLGDESRVSYGIAAYAHANRSGTSAITHAIHDITADRQALDELVTLCNHLCLSPCHLQDVVDDFLART